MRILSRWTIADMVFLYRQDDRGAVELVALPGQLEEQMVDNEQQTADSLVQLKLIGDPYALGFSQGRTLRNSGTTQLLRLVGQRERGNTIVTELTDGRGHTLLHELERRETGAAVRTTFVNQSAAEARLELLASFSLGGITPFDPADAPGTLVLHRMRSTWSMEGRLDSQPVEELQLEPSWSRYAANSLRYGQAGSMPVKGFYPFAAVEDVRRGVTWAAQVAHPGSWQLEVYRRDNLLCLSGGLADHELGHWVKRVAPGESFTTPDALLTVCQGGVDEASARLVEMHAYHPAPVDRELPVMFNEFCTTWGNPTQENIARIAARLKDKGLRYFVIDAGWYNADGKGWERNMGDWRPNQGMFPEGIAQAAAVIRENGMIPGLWFELEVCGQDADAFQQTELLLHRDGVPVTTGIRRFWDFRQPAVRDLLWERVFRFLWDNGFRYLKIDYNDSIGLGVDGAESPGEGLRQHLAAYQDFLREVHRRLPDLVIENCSSGGHRTEPSMMGLCSMASFSDAHECLEIPVIAANLQRAIRPRQSQIWAVLRKTDDPRRLQYSLNSALLGRMCLSGDVLDLTEAQWAVVEGGVGFYKRVAPIIREGRSRRFGPPVFSYRHPTGWQAVLRQGPAGLLAVFHTFGGGYPAELAVPCPGAWRIADDYGTGVARLRDDELVYRPDGDFASLGVLLERA